MAQTYTWFKSDLLHISPKNMFISRYIGAAYKELAKKSLEIVAIKWRHSNKANQIKVLSRDKPSRYKKDSYKHASDQSKPLEKISSSL